MEAYSGAGNFTFVELEEDVEDLAKLETWVGKSRARDPFGAPLCGEVELELKACR